MPDYCATVQVDLALKAVGQMSGSLSANLPCGFQVSDYPTLIVHYELRAVISTPKITCSFHAEASFITEGDEGIDRRGAAGGEETRGEAHRHDNGHDRSKCPWIRGRNAGNLAGEKAGQHIAGEETDQNACCDQPETVDEHEAENIRLLRSEGHTNANLMSPQRDGVGHHAEYADDNQKQPDDRES